jgi:hypothetical protein
MPTYYVDPDATGTDAGTSWTDAWTTLQRAIDGTGGTKPVAGDTIYCRCSVSAAEIPGATIDVDGNVGSAASGHIKYIGCNAAGAVDGTRYKINVNSGGFKGLTYGASQSFIWFENFEVYGATDGVKGNAIAGTNNVWINVYCHDNSLDGFAASRSGTGSMYVRCRAESNGDSGWSSPFNSTVRFIACVSKDNGEDGWEGLTSQSFTGCIAHNNGELGFEGGDSTSFVNCVSDENAGDGILLYNGVMIGCRITNNDLGGTGTQYGIKVTAGTRALWGWNYYSNPAADAETNGLLDAIPYGADADTNETGGTEGYTDGGADDFNLTEAATMRDVAITLD